MNILIIEDEEYTAKDLSNTLCKFNAEIKILKILKTVEQSIDFLSRCSAYDIDLIFADIQLPDGLSFDIFKTCQISAPVIFCTAYDQYTMDAFEANGIDYILKPFGIKTISKALDKYFNLENKFISSQNRSLKNIVKFANEFSISESSTSILVYKGENIIPLKIYDIAVFYINDKSVFAKTLNNQNFLINHTLEELEELSNNSFFRTNRQFLVNRRAVVGGSKYFQRKILVNLSIPFDYKIIVGKLKVASFLDWLTRPY